MAVLYALFGGAGTLVGPIIGVLAIESISFTLSRMDTFKSYWPVVLGVILLVVVTFRLRTLLSFIVSRRKELEIQEKKNRMKNRRISD